MSTYHAPLADMQFVLNHLAGLGQVGKLPGFEDATPETVTAILEEASKFATNVLDPLNWTGDREGAQWLEGGDVKVDFFTAHAGPRVVHGLDALGSLLVGLFGALIAWRTGVGAAALREAGETSAILGWPVWVAQAAMVPGFVLMAAAGFYMCALHLRAARVSGEDRP